MNNSRPCRFINLSGEIEWHLRVVESGSPRILVECPKNRPRFANCAADPIRQYGFGVGQVMQNKPNRPSARRMFASQLLSAQVEVFERSISRRFEMCNDVHT